MRALLRNSDTPRDFAMGEVPEPVTPPGMVKIKVAYAGICGSDLHIYLGQESGLPQGIHGHEFSGTIAELGIGTNEAAKLCGIILEDEKLYGTVHIAFGTNTSFGGITKADCHLDGIILNPTLYLDDECIIRKGEFL